MIPEGVWRKRFRMNFFRFFMPSSAAADKVKSLLLKNFFAGEYSNMIICIFARLF
jgi:hypothetical protein